MLQNYITEVLFKQQTCCVPEVGTFTIQHIPAHFNVVEQQLVPPREQILFEEKWDNDLACAQWVSHKENLVESVARLKMVKYVEQFKQTLAEGNTITLSGIGTLHKDPYGQLVFTPHELPDTWTPLDLQPVLRPEVAPKVTVGNTEMVNQQVVNYMSASPDEGSNFKWWWVVFPLLLVALGGAGWYFWQQQQHGATNESITPETSIRPAVTPIDTPAVKQDSIPAVELVAPVIPANDSVQYYAVYMTYNLLVNAEKMAKNQRNWGRPTTEMYTRDSTQYRLAIPVTALVSDTAAVKDSLFKKLGVRILFMEKK
ncbi:hypothetical protein [uncultured Chitinophaga sp.]|uniref:HU domain-containing protein n=1 Tax=uncultured Chitinophaga sp. TaxID=339340 RepID=UPI0025D070B8|nr:hypothetical protein [uncultured Chitinophaga sp.]